MSNTRTIPIPCDEVSFYRFYVELLNPIMNLRKKELDVLAQLLYYNNKYKDLEEKIRFKLVFDQDTKIEIQKALGISEASFNNNLTELRKKKIVKDNKIEPGYQVFWKNGKTLAFKFIKTTTAAT